jgi:uncharacterized membrane protein YfcA
LELMPDGLSPMAALALIAASFVTSGLTSAFGIGGGVALLALMGYMLPVAQLIPVHGVVQLGSNAGRAFVQRAYVRWSTVLPFLAGAAIGAAAGAPFVMRIDAPLLQVALAAFIILVTWARLPGLANGGPLTFAAGGLVTTFATMFFGATGPLTAVFFEKALADRCQYAGSHAAAMTAQHALKVAAFTAAGFAFAQWLPVLAAMIASGFLGTIAGARLLERLGETNFRRAFRWLLTLLALDLARRGLAAYFA